MLMMSIISLLSPSCLETQPMYIPVEQLLTFHYRELSGKSDTSSKSSFSVCSKS